MADSVEMQDIRTLDIDKTVKGFALTEYVFKSQLCTQSTTNGDSIRWYQETAADLTATAPSVVANISPLSIFPTLEVTWTRNTSYPKKYAAEGFISIEDIKTTDIDVVARTLLRLTRAVVKQVDTDIWNVLTENQSAVNINAVTSTAAWNATSGQDPIEDILEALQGMETNNYDSSQAVIVVSPTDYKSLMTWLISTKGVNFTGFTSNLVQNGQMSGILGHRIIVSNNVTADYAAVIIPGAATWKSLTDTTSAVIEEKGIGNKYRVWEHGIAILTDPKKVSLISNTQL